MILVVVSNCVKLRICLHVFPEKSIKRFGTLKWSQEGENSVRHLPTIDLPYTKRRRFPDQPFGLGDSWSAGKLMTFQALFSRPTEFDPYIYITTRPQALYLKKMSDRQTKAGNQECYET